MNYFSEIPEGKAIIHSRGVYRQVLIAVRAGRVYAKHGGGYVRINTGGSTSSPAIRWSEIDGGDGTISETGHEVRWAANEAPKAEAAE